VNTHQKSVNDTVPVVGAGLPELVQVVVVLPDLGLELTPLLELLEHLSSFFTLANPVFQDSLAILHKSFFQAVVLLFFF